MRIKFAIDPPNHVGSFRAAVVSIGEVLAGDLPLRVRGQVEAFFEVIGRSALAGGRANLPEPMQMTGEPTL